MFITYSSFSPGFLSTLDDNAPGNYGIRDILKVLEYIQRYISLFGGDPKKVTIVGGGSGSGIAGILMLSPLSIHPQCKYLPMG